MTKLPDVIWKTYGIRPVYHLFECWFDDVTKRRTTPVCGDGVKAFVYRPDGIYCRVCVAMEGILP